MVYIGNEIITLQFGHYSNFIGSHWWNCQEAGFEYVPETLSEINHDVLFREGQTSSDEITFTPRLLLVDLKGTLGALPERGKLYESPSVPDTSLPLWPTEKVCIQNQETAPKNEFQQDLEQADTSSATLPDGFKEKNLAVRKLYHLEDSVRSWADFLRPHLHPRSIYIVNEYQYNDKSLPFDTFLQGHALWSRPRFKDEFTDSIRSYMEEADNLQGFQILADSFDGFSGLSCAGMQYLRDEYPSKSTLCFLCQPPQVSLDAPKQDSIRIINQALTLSSLAEHSSMFVPISGSTEAWRKLGSPLHLPHIVYRPDLFYHSSAIVAAALDTVSLIYRLRTSSERLGDLTVKFSQWNRLAAALSLRLPLALKPDATLLDTLEKWDGPLTHSLTPGIDLPSSQWLQSFVLRGIPESRLMRVEQRDLNSPNPAYSCKTLAQLLKTFLLFDGQSAVSTFTQVTTAGSGFNTSAPFPQIFNEYITSDGQLGREPRLQHLGVNQAPVVAGLHSDKSMGPLLKSLHSEAKRVNIRSLHQFADSGLESTELLESLEQLLCLSECYSETQMDL